MKRLLALLVGLVAIPSAFAANPSYDSFNPNQFQYLIPRIWLKDGMILTNVHIRGGSSDVNGQPLVGGIIGGGNMTNFGPAVVGMIAMATDPNGNYWTPTNQIPLLIVGTLTLEGLTNGTAIFHNNGDNTGYLTNGPAGGDTVWTNTAGLIGLAAGQSTNLLILDAGDYVMFGSTNNSIYPGSKFYLSGISTNGHSVFDMEFLPDTDAAGSIGLGLNLSDPGFADGSATLIAFNFQPTTNLTSIASDWENCALSAQTGNLTISDGAEVGVLAKANGYSSFKSGLVAHAHEQSFMVSYQTNVGAVAWSDADGALGPSIGLIAMAGAMVDYPKTDGDSAALVLDNLDSGFPLLIGRTNNGDRVFLLDSDGSVASAGTISANAAVITNNLASINSAGAANYIDVSKNAPATITNMVAAAVSYLHATNGVAGEGTTVMVLMPNGSGSDQTLTINANWKTNVFSPVPPVCTNGTITIMHLRYMALEDTSTAARQTNLCVSFEYFK